MATNPYFHPSQPGYASEHTLYEDMTIEAIQWAGLDYYYIPRKLSGSIDQIFGEDVLSSFESYAMIELYLMDVEGFGGESEMLSKFSLEIRDTASFIISRKRYAEVVMPIVPEDRNEAIKFRPCEGDLIYAPFSKSLFEISFVEDEAPSFYQLNKKFVWTLRCELMKFNNDTVRTGNAEIDAMFGADNMNRLNKEILLENSFRLLTEDGGSFIDEGYVVSKPYDEIMGYGDNDAIRKEFKEILDFSEDNPFSEID